VGIELRTLVFERAKTVHALDGAATVTGQISVREKAFLGPLSWSQSHLLICNYFRTLQVYFMYEKKKENSPRESPGKRYVSRPYLGAPSLRIISRPWSPYKADSIEIHSLQNKLNLRLKHVTVTHVQCCFQSFDRPHDCSRNKLEKSLIAYLI
jgi:hypothetical protein